MQDREGIVFERTRDTDQRIHEPCVFVSPGLIHIFNQLSGGSFPSYAILACVAWRFWLGELSDKGGRGQRNREEIGAGAFF